MLAERRKRKDQFLEQFYGIMFCVKLGKNGAEMLEMLRKTFGDDTTKQGETFM